ncbi:hypothetical protein [Phenylobacterium soli]|uniref:hypothetical protein n=1 Tax=Phenylobacterium soli TaxID=2170551 RepID=UPI00361F22C4
MGPPPSPPPAPLKAWPSASMPPPPAPCAWPLGDWPPAPPWAALFAKPTPLRVRLALESTKIAPPMPAPPPLSPPPAATVPLPPCASPWAMLRLAMVMAPLSAQNTR